MKSKTQFIEQDEVLESELYLSETYVCRTQKRLYVSKHTKKRKTERVVNLNTIQSVSLEEGKEKRSAGTLLTGLLFGATSAFFASKESLKPVFLSLLFIGIALTIIGIILKLPRYYSKLIISSYGHPIELSFEKISGAKEEQLKKLIYSTLVYSDPQKQEKEPTYDASQDEAYTQIPVVEPAVQPELHEEPQTEAPEEQEAEQAII